MDATPEQVAEGAVVVKVLASVLDRLVNANAPLVHHDTSYTKFHALKAPSIAIHQYLERIQKYACCSNECFILALIYIDRLIQRNNFMLTHLNVHRVVISAILVAAKFFDDAYYNNAYYAKVGGVLVSELNSLEVEFLFRINFGLRVTPDLYQKYHEELLSHAAPLDFAGEEASGQNMATPVMGFATMATASAAAPFQPKYEVPVQSSGNTTTRQYSQVENPNVAAQVRFDHQSQFSSSNLSRQLQTQNDCDVMDSVPQQHQPHFGGFPARLESATVSLSDVDESDMPFVVQQQQPQSYANHNQTLPVYVSTGQSAQYSNSNKFTNTSCVTTSHHQSAQCSPHQHHFTNHYMVATSGARS